MADCQVSYERTTPPAREPVELNGPAGQKTHSKIDITDDDGLVDACVKAARAHLEDAYGLACITQTWKMYLDQFPEWEIVIRKRPVRSVTSIKYYDTATPSVEQTLNALLYEVDLKDFLARIAPVTGQTWPATATRYNAVTIEFVAGYGDDPEDVHEDLSAALRLHAGDLYAHRETVVVGPPIAHLNTYENLISPHRIRPV